MYQLEIERKKLAKMHERRKPSATLNAQNLPEFLERRNARLHTAQSHMQHDVQLGRHVQKLAYYWHQAAMPVRDELKQIFGNGEDDATHLRHVVASMTKAPASAQELRGEALAQQRFAEIEARYGNSAPPLPDTTQFDFRDLGSTGVQRDSAALQFKSYQDDVAPISDREYAEVGDQAGSQESHWEHQQYLNNLHNVAVAMTNVAYDSATREHDAISGAVASFDRNHGGAR